MEWLASMFVAKPLNILLVAIEWFAGYLALRFGRRDNARQRRPLLLAAAAWGLYAVWEWVVLTRTPEANIRFDLLTLWPVLASLSAWALYRVLR